MVTVPIHSDGHNKKRKWYQGKVTSKGNKDHIKAVDRLIQIFKDNGFVCETDQKFVNDSLRGELPYEPDVLVNSKYVVEADGKNHGKRIQMMKDFWRDKWFREVKGFKTVRYWVWDLVGRKKLSDSEVMKHFYYWVSR